MKHLRSTTACVITLGMITSAPLIQAAEQSSDSNVQGGQPEQMQQRSGTAPDLSASYRSDKLIGMKVMNNTGEELGEISKIILDANGQATHVVLSSGGVLGVAENEYVIPWNQVQLTQGSDHALIDVQKDAISSEFSAFEIKEETAPMMRDEKPGGMGMGGMGTER